MYARLTQNEWERNVNDSLAWLLQPQNGGDRNPAWIKALRSALRIARDFDHNVEVLWDNKTQTFRLYGRGERAVGNFDICLPSGHVIH